MKNARAILGVSGFASKEEIKQAYFKRLRIVHPDRFDPGSADWQSAGEMLRELNEAYSFLRNLPQGYHGGDNEEDNEDDGYNSYADEAGGAQSPTFNGRVGCKSIFIKICGWAYRWGLFALALVCASLLAREVPLYAAVALFFIPASLCDYLFGWKRVTRIWDWGQRVVVIFFLALVFWQVMIPSSYSPLTWLPSDELAECGLPPLASSASGHSRPAASEESVILDTKRGPQPELSVPPSGAYWNFTGLVQVAPFTIETSGTGYYVVKLVVPSAQTAAMEFFIHAGDTIAFDVPLGVYRMRYASGEKWYGKDVLFGPDTVYSQSDTVFNFDIQDNQVNGYTVTLHKVPGGNMQTRRIPKTDF